MIFEKQKLMQKEVALHIEVDKSSVEQMQLIQQLDEEDKSMIFIMVNTMLTKKKFKDLFQKNIATL